VRTGVCVVAVINADSNRIRDRDREMKESMRAAARPSQRRSLRFSACCLSDRLAMLARLVFIVTVGLQ